MSRHSLESVVGRFRAAKESPAATNRIRLAGAVRLPRTWWGPPQVPHGAQAE